MNLSQNTSWFLGIVAFVALFTGSSMLVNNDSSDQQSMIPFSDLSNADIDRIIAVKAKMQVAEIQSY